MSIKITNNAMYEERLYDLKNINTGKAHKRNYNQETV